MNKENLLKVAEYIENAPKDQFHMGAWFGQYEREINSDGYDDDIFWSDASDFYLNSVEDYTDKAIDKQLNCGTTACIAGWAATAFYYEDKEEYYDFCSQYDHDMGYSYVETFAKRYLELTEQEAQCLFFCNAGSIWYSVKDEYGFDFHPSVNESWDIDNKLAADVLKRVANGELKLPTTFEY